MKKENRNVGECMTKKGKTKSWIIASNKISNKKE